jgi:peptidoglycan/LPS O-acetylase OafA/YrhL
MKTNVNTLSVAACEPKTHFYFLDALRGIAALWVVLYHAEAGGHLGALTAYFPSWLTLVLFRSGHLGVAVFFVLSGFVIAHSLRNTKIDFASSQNFMMRRFLRLSPPYYVAIVLVLITNILSSSIKGETLLLLNQPFFIGRLLAHLGYVQNLLGFTGFDSVYWTLSLEMQFYLVFCTLLGCSHWLEQSGKPGNRLIFGMSAIVAAVFPMGILESKGLDNTFLPLGFSFLLGVFAYWSWKGRLKPIFFYAYSVVLLIPAIVQQSMFEITAVLISIFILEVSRENRIQSWLGQSWLQFLGRISYSLYLIHNPLSGMIFFVTYKVLPKSTGSALIGLTATVVICICSANLMWYLVEKPSISWSQKIRLSAPTPSVLG